MDFFVGFKLDFIMAIALSWDAFGYNELVQILPRILFDVEILKLLAGLVVEDHHWGLARNLLELSSLVLGGQVPVDEVLHLGELVQTSPSAGLDNTSIDSVVLELYSVLSLGLILCPG